jgi:hypothetical protein
VAERERRKNPLLSQFYFEAGEQSGSSTPNKPPALVSVFCFFSFLFFFSRVAYGYQQ